MITKKELNFFKKEGYLIKNTNSIDSLNQIQSFIFNTLNKHSKKNFFNDSKINFFTKFHKNINKKKLNEIRVSAINDINKKNGFRDLYYEAAKELLDDLVGNEVAMQKKINLSIQIPNDKKSILPMHSDIYAGESPFEVVIWIPMMNVKKSSHSMFITNPRDNIKINKDVTTGGKSTLQKIYQKHKKKFKFIKIDYGQILIFSPIIQHGNVINRTDETRISLNCRFKSLLTPFDVFSKTHRNIPHFFQPYNIKPLTQIGFNFINAINKKKFHGSL
tara:strand:- start:1759 stop:2583 length:825 start_codon:yes stop_codon:yes gene_type:complete